MEAGLVIKIIMKVLSAEIALHCQKMLNSLCPVPITAFLWQLMRFTMLQLLKNLRSHSQGKEGKEITDADILKWANNKVKKADRTSQIESFKVIQ